MFDFQFPAIITVIDHLMGHATIDADVLAGDEAGLVGTEEQHHVGYVHRITDTSRRLLCGIGAFIDGIGSVYPTRGGNVGGEGECMVGGCLFGCIFLWVGSCGLSTKRCSQ